MDKLKDRLLRFDARSLGLFRWLFGISLITDLLHRWDWVRAFYSNEGVLPNHNHLFLQKDAGEVWSLYHSFSSAEEAQAAFLITLFIYLCFTIGWHTRVFHTLSLVCLVSLAGRNVLLDAPANSVAIGLLALTLFLPLGLRFGVDSLRRSLAAFAEKTPRDLDDRGRPQAKSPRASLVPLAVLGFLALVYYGAALQQTGSTWKEGTALYYALHVDRWTSAAGVALRDVSSGLLSLWTRALWLAELAIVPLALIPAARRVTRSMAIALMLLHGLTIGILFTFGLYGWSLAAAAALLIPKESWEALKRRRPIQLYYDEDCGICLWLARLIKRLDLRGQVTFHSNAEEPPEGVTREMLDTSMVVLDDEGAAHTDARAVSELLRALPLLTPLGWLVRLPGIFQLVRWGYSQLAERRLDVSVALGLGACGIPDGNRAASVAAPAQELAASTSPTSAAEAWHRSAAAPVDRWLSAVRALFVNGAAAALLLAFTAQSAQANDLGASLGLQEANSLARASRILRVTAPWGVWAPDPPSHDEALVVEAETRSGWKVDPLTGHPPALELEEPARTRKGVLWEAYQRHLVQEDYTRFRKEFRSYLTRGGFALNSRSPEHQIADLNVYWVSRPIPAPGGEASGEVEKQLIFSQRGPIRNVMPSRRHLRRKLR